MTTDHIVTKTLLKLYWPGMKDSAPSILSFQTNRLKFCFRLDVEKTLIYIRNVELNFNGDDNNMLYFQVVVENSSLKTCALLEKFI